MQAIRECEETFAAQRYIRELAAAAEQEEAKARRVAAKEPPRRRSFSFSRELVWFAIIMSTTGLVTGAMSGGIKQWLYSIVACELFIHVLPMLVMRVVRSEAPAPASVEPPDYDILGDDELAYLAYQFSIASGIEPDGLWVPEIGEIVRGSAADAPLAEIKSINLHATPPQYTGQEITRLSLTARKYWMPRYVSWSLNEMKPATQGDLDSIDSWKRKR
jgi:hypothetical protein